MAQCFLRSRCMVFPKASPTLQFVRWRSGAGAPLTLKPPREKATPSEQVLGRGVVDRGDIGLLSDTFIMPTGAKLPKLFSEPKARYQLIKHQIKQRILDLRDMIVFRAVTKHKLHLREPKKVAPSLYKDMYTAFAEGDMVTLRLICGVGLLGSFQKRIIVRGGIKLEWKLHQMLSRPKIVSRKAHHYMGMNINRIQAIIRIHSMQSLSKFTPKGELIEGSDQPKEVVEYVVIEKKYEMGKESPWYIWGTTEETTLESWAESKRRQAEMMRIQYTSS